MFVNCWKESPDAFFVFFTFIVAFSCKIDYNIIEIGGVNMNEFEESPQSRNNDVVDSIKGFTFSFVFFAIIFAIGVVINVVTQ